MPRFTEVPSTLGKNSRNAKTIYQLLKIAKDTEESIFQRNKEYIKLKAKKINLNEIEFILTGFYYMKNQEIGDPRGAKLNPFVTRYPEESIYWNLRALEEKVCDKETRYHFFNNLIHLYDDTKEYELTLEYGQTAQAWLESNDVNVYWNDCTMYDCLGHAANELKRYEEAKKHFKTRLKYCTY
jgi:tetratricopeptide (TPR) repeat protein